MVSSTTEIAHNEVAGDCSGAWYAKELENRG